MALSVISLLRGNSIAFGCEADMRTVDRSNQSDVNDPKPPFHPTVELQASPRQLLSMQRRGTNPYKYPALRYPAARANACVGLGGKFPRKELSCRLGHDVAAADIDAGGREGAVRLLGGGGGRDGGPGF